MANPPRLPNLDPADMAWVRWASSEISRLSGDTSTLRSSVTAAHQLAGTTAAAHATTVERVAASQVVAPAVPLGPPQTPSMPTLNTDHGTVTIRWDGQVHATLAYVPELGDDPGSLVEPAQGFNHIAVYRADSADGPWTIIGSAMGRAGSIVDSNVNVGSEYFYYFVTTDNLKAESNPSAVASIVVAGVDLGTLNQDVTDAIQAAKDAGDAGLAAGAAGQDAADAAQAAAESAEAQAATALQNASAAQDAASTALTAANGKNKVVYSTSAASGTAGYTNGDIWYQHDANNVVIAQWQYDGSAWNTQTVSGALVASGINAGNITAGSIDSARIAANTISASQMVAGTITAASGILADAVVTNAKIADLAVNTAKIADLAVNNAKINDLDGNKIQAATVVAGKLAANSVTTNNIVAGSIDTNRLAAGAITADKLNIGAVNPQGNPTDRVPMPLNNTSWWSTAGLVNLPLGSGWTIKPENTTSGSSGLIMTSTSTQRALVGVTPQVPPPASGKITVQWKATASVQVYCHEFDGTTDHWNLLTTGASGVNTHPLASSTLTWGVYFIVPSGNSPAVVTLNSAHVFEVISTSGTQGVELGPEGMQFYDNNGSLAMDLTTNAQQFFSVVDSSGGDPQTVASIDQFGNGSFTTVAANGDIQLSGISLSPYDPQNTTYPDSLINATPNGSGWDSSVPLLDRLGRGVIYDVTWNNQNARSISTQYARIAQDSFILEDGRSYEFVVNLGGLQTDNASGVNVYLELQLKVGSPNTSVTDGTVIGRAVIYNGDNGTFSIPPITLSASNSAVGLDTANRTIQAGVPIYWQLNTNLSKTPTAAYSFAEFGNARGLTIIDVGSNSLTRPVNGADSLANVTDTTTSGGSTGTSSGGTTATSKTVTFTAKSSRTWNNSGSTIVTGTGQYTNGSAMYYGYGASPMGSWFGNFQDSGGHSLNSIVGGKHVTAATLTVKNTYTSASSGATVTFGTAATTTAPSSIGTPTNNTWNTTFSKGGSKSISLNTAVRNGIAGNSVNSFVLGVSSSSANYSYFAGASQSSPPTLKVTYY